MPNYRKFGTLPKNAIVIFGLILTIISIVSPILWDYYSHRSAVEFRIESSTSLLPADPLLKDFLITYQGKPIKNLTRMDCLLVNSGSTSIAEDDIVVEPIIHIPRENGLIAAILLGTDPQNLYVSLNVDSEFNEVKIKFNLLNPGETIRLAIYMNGSSEVTPSITARIKGLKEINVINNIKKDLKIEDDSNWLSSIFNTVKYLGAVLLIIIIVWSGYEAFIFRRTRNLIKKNPKKLNEFNNINDFKNFIDKKLKALSPDQKEKLLTKELENAEKDFSPDNKEKLIAAIVRALNTTSGSESLFIVSIIIMIITIYYYWPF